MTHEEFKLMPEVEGTEVFRNVTDSEGENASIWLLQQTLKSKEKRVMIFIFGLPAAGKSTLIQHGMTWIDTYRDGQEGIVQNPLKIRQHRLGYDELYSEFIAGFKRFENPGFVNNGDLSQYIANYIEECRAMFPNLDLTDDANWPQHIRNLVSKEMYFRITDIFLSEIPDDLTQEGDKVIYWVEFPGSVPYTVFEPTTEEERMMPVSLIPGAVPNRCSTTIPQLSKFLRKHQYPQLLPTKEPVEIVEGSKVNENNKVIICGLFSDKRVQDLAGQAREMVRLLNSFFNEEFLFVYTFFLTNNLSENIKTQLNNKLRIYGLTLDEVFTVFEQYKPNLDKIKVQLIVNTLAKQNIRLNLEDAQYTSQQLVDLFKWMAPTEIIQGMDARLEEAIRERFDYLKATQPSKIDNWDQDIWVPTVDMTSSPKTEVTDLLMEQSDKLRRRAFYILNHFEELGLPTSMAKVLFNLFQEGTQVTLSLRRRSN